MQLAYSSAEHSSIGTAPYELVYKEHPRSKFEMLTEKLSPTTMEEKNNRIKGEAADLFRQAVESDIKLSEKRRKEHNKKCSFKPFAIGSHVWKRDMRVTNSARLFTPGEKDSISGFKSRCHRRVGGHLTDLKNMDVY